MRAAEADGVNSMTAEKRQWMREALYSMPLAQIRAIRPTGNVDATTQAIARAQVQAKALGAASTDLVFFPFAPCRYIDTRNVGGKITGARGFDFANSGNVYGGAAGCNLTTLSGAGENQIAAVSLNMTIVDTSTAAAPGFATARPAGATASTALVNWTVSSAGFQLGNAAVITNDQTGAANELEIFTSGAVHAIVDVAGVFAAPTATLPDCFLDNTSTETPANGVAWNFNSVACPATHRAVSSGSYAFATDAYVHHQLDSNQTPPDKAFCYGRNVSGGQHDGSLHSALLPYPGALTAQVIPAAMLNRQGRLRAPLCFAPGSSLPRATGKSGGEPPLGMASARAVKHIDTLPIRRPPLIGCPPSATAVRCRSLAAGRMLRRNAPTRRIPAIDFRLTAVAEGVRP